MNKSAKKKQVYGGEMKANREETLFTYDDLPEEEEGEYDTEEDNLDEDTQDNMDDRDLETESSTNATIPIPSNSSTTPYGTPPTRCQQYVGSLPNELEVL